ncbi:hypothetical protein ACFQVC_11795 [Streptomyces monticola]|uniref:Secreted protein n=1 Tax=Streptomyces monticola TaxID=2666263 RepID=A0ABW2JFT2_9ACTN
MFTPRFTSRKTLGTVASAALVVLAAPAVAHADGPEKLANLWVPSKVDANNPLPEDVAAGLDEAVGELVNKVRTERKDRVDASVGDEQGH